MPKHVSDSYIKVGVVDIVNKGGCEIHLINETMVFLDNSLCSILEEGDTIIVNRK